MTSTLTSALTESHFAVDVAADGEEAQYMLSEVSYDAVVLDLGLPGLDGLDVIRSLRAFSQVPVVVITARTEEADRTRRCPRRRTACRCSGEFTRIVAV